MEIVEPFISLPSPAIIAKHKAFMKEHHLPMTGERVEPVERAVKTIKLRISSTQLKKRYS